MTIRDETAGSDDPKSLLQQLQSSILAGAADTTPDDESHLDQDEQWVSRTLGDGRLSPSAAVSAAADEVIPPLSPRPEARARMIEAASRALANRRKTNGLLPVLLRTARVDAQLDVADVAAAAGLPERLVDDLESGRTSVDKVDAESIGAWIRAVPTPRDTALAALERSLHACWTGDQPLLAAGSGERAANIAEFVDVVRRILDTEQEQS